MKYLLAALGGAVVGAGAALLLAPQSGRATRKLIADKTTKCTNTTRDLVEGKTKHLKNKMQGLRHQAEGILAQGHEIVDQGKASLGLDSKPETEMTAAADPSPSI